LRIADCGLEMAPMRRSHSDKIRNPQWEVEFRPIRN
jgi:hypothetical protein